MSCRQLNKLGNYYTRTTHCCVNRSCRPRSCHLPPTNQSHSSAQSLITSRCPLETCSLRGKIYLASSKDQGQPTQSHKGFRKIINFEFIIYSNCKVPDHKLQVKVVGWFAPLPRFDANYALTFFQFDYLNQHIIILKLSLLRFASF